MSLPLLAATPLTASFAAKVWFATVHRLGVVFAALGFNINQHRLLTEEACTTAAPAMKRSSPLRQLTRVFRSQADLFRRGMEAIPHRTELSQPKTQFFSLKQLRYAPEHAVLPPDTYVLSQNIAVLLQNRTVHHPIDLSHPEAPLQFPTPDQN